jgi:hypothetical protein
LEWIRLLADCGYIEIIKGDQHRPNHYTVGGSIQNLKSLREVLPDTSSGSNENFSGGSGEGTEPNPFKPIPISEGQHVFKKMREAIESQPTESGEF